MKFSLLISPLLISSLLSLVLLGCSSELPDQASPSPTPSDPVTEPVAEVPVAEVPTRPSRPSEDSPRAEAPTAPPTSSPAPRPPQSRPPQSADPSLPQADANGDYTRRNSHLTWVVVDPDPNGLNCRWSENMPTEWYAPDAVMPDQAVYNWTVVNRFSRDTVLAANITPAGFSTMMDNRGLPWLKVNIGPNDTICLVRANSRFVRPL